jgi:hypothetical protein
MQVCSKLFYKALGAKDTCKDNDHSNVTVSGTVPMYNHDTAEYVAVSKAPVCVEFKVTKDKALKQVVSTGRAFTSSDIDYTLKAGLLQSARGLQI